MKYIWDIFLLGVAIDIPVKIVAAMAYETLKNVFFFLAELSFIRELEERSSLV